VNLFLKEKAGNSAPADLLPFLENTPDADSVDGDETN